MGPATPVPLLLLSAYSHRHSVTTQALLELMQVRLD